MTWQDLGSIGELVGAIAVVVSLIYLAYQIRQNTNQINQNTRAVRATAVDSSTRHTMMIRNAVVENEDVARIFHLGSADPEGLPEQELLRYRLLLHNIVESLCNAFLQSRYAELPETWNAQIPIAQRVLSTKGGTWFWSHYGREFDATFQQEVRRVSLDLTSSPDLERVNRPPAVS